jgi:hypothetical protein
MYENKSEFVELTRIFSSKGPDGLNRLERRNLASYNRTNYLFEKFLATRKQAQTLQLTHEHILGLKPFYSSILLKHG